MRSPDEADSRRVLRPASSRAEDWLPAIEHPLGEELVQGDQQLLQIQMEQADEIVDAQQHGEEGQHQEIGQGRR